MSTASLSRQAGGQENRVLRLVQAAPPHVPYRLDHLSQHGAANNPKGLPVQERSALESAPCHPRGGFHPSPVTLLAGTTGTKERKAVRLHGAAPRSRPLTSASAPPSSWGQPSFDASLQGLLRRIGTAFGVLACQTINSTKISNDALNVCLFV